MITSIIMFRMKLPIHSHTSTVAPLKCGNGSVTSSYNLLDMWLLIHAVIKVNPSLHSDQYLSQRSGSPLDTVCLSKPILAYHKYGTHGMVNRNSLKIPMFSVTSQWRHRGYHHISNHRHLDCSYNSLLRLTGKETSKLHTTGLHVWGKFIGHRFPS